MYIEKFDLDTLQQYEGRQVQISKNDVVHEGILRGLGQSTVSDGKSAMRAWLLECEREKIEFAPWDGWDVQVL